MRFNLPNFTIKVEPIANPLSRNLDLSRDWYQVTIHRKTSGDISFPVGSPVYGDFDEIRAARSAISFASEPSAHDNPQDSEWASVFGEDLSNEAFNHRTLGAELRKG